MIDFPGYRIKEVLSEGKCSTICRAWREKDQTSVILKVLTSERPSNETLGKLKLEYKLANAVDDPGVIKMYAIIQHRNCYALVMEDRDAISLNQFLKTKTPSVYETDILTFLAHAKWLTDSLGSIHKQDIIHKDISSNNILISTARQELAIIDFGNATQLSKENPNLAPLENLEGTLSYLSPEQTGRMNRSIDYRTDFYSLGTTFYHMLTGQLPCAQTDILELVYCHIAQDPVPPHKLNARVPLVLSQMVMKLLAKPAEERYQSCYGLSADLARCAEQLRDSDQIIPFELGRDDHFHQLQIPETLYGRDNKIHIMLNTFEAVRSGASKVAFMPISGYAGIGKTSLVHEIHKPLVRCGGLYIAGKLDQFQHNIPYAPFIQAFQDLIHQLLKQPDAKLSHWKEKINNALNENGQVILALIPELEKIIGPQPELASVDADESKNRFVRTFLHFSQVFMQQAHPLIVFLDDLQWADLPTLELMQHLLTDSDSRYLFIIGAYRNNEVDESHLLTPIIADIGKQIAINPMTLLAISLDAVQQLIADTLQLPITKVSALAALVYEKTRGNPFFTNRFINALYQDELLYIDFNTGSWEYDIAKIHSLALTDNVVQLIVSRLQLLPQETQRVLSWAASIGNQFDLRTLSVIAEQPPQHVYSLLWAAIEHEVIEPIGDTYQWVIETSGQEELACFRFIHDRLQQAANALIPDDEQNRLHVKIGRLLLKSMNEEEQRQHVFDLVDHLNFGGELIDTSDELTQLIQLNVTAAQKAKASSAFKPAYHYILNAFVCCNKLAWKLDLDLIYHLYFEKGQLEYLCSQWESSITTFRQALNHAQNDQQRTAVNVKMMRVYRVQNNFQAALDIGLKALAALGVLLPAYPSEEKAQEEVECGYQYLIKDKNISAYAQLPDSNDPKQLQILSLLYECTSPAFSLGSYLGPILGVKMAESCVRHGNNELASIAYLHYVCFTLIGFQKEYAHAREFGLLGMKLLNERYYNKSTEVVVQNIWGGMVCPYTGTLEQARSVLIKSYYSGVGIGSYQPASYCAANFLFTSFAEDVGLTDLQSRLNQIAPSLTKIAPNIAHWYSEAKACIYNLTNDVEDIHQFSDSQWPHHQQFLQNTLEQKDLLTMCIDAVMHLCLANWFGDFETGLRYCNIAKKSAAGIRSLSFEPICWFHQAIAYSMTYESVSDESKQQHYQAILDIRDIFIKCVKYGPERFFHKLSLIEAELKRIDGNFAKALDHYDATIDSAIEHHFLANAAMAAELAARCCQHCGRDRWVKHYIQEAHYLYTRWGATAVARRLEKQYSSYFTARNIPKEITETFAIANTTVRDSNVSPLDVVTVMKSSDFISKELGLDRLLEQLMILLIENAGAQKGALLLFEQEKWVIAVKGALSQREISIQAMPSLPLEGSKELAEEIVRYVINSQETVVLRDARIDIHYQNSPYIIEQQPKSVLCMPVFNQQQLIAVSYLENNLITDAFQPERIKLLSLLSTQAAISLENALLCNRLMQMNEELEQRVEQRTVELKEAKDTAEEATRTKSQFLAAMSHEIRTPMSAVLGMAELLRDTSLTDEQQDCVSTIEGSGDALLGIINDILDFSKIEAGKMPLEATQFSLFNCVRDIGDMLAPMAHTKQVELSILIEKNVLDIWVGDSVRLRQIIINFINNAIKFTDQGSVLIQIRQAPIEGSDNYQLHVVITDTGIGIEKEKQQQLFKAFSQLDNSRARCYGGSGLGLAIAKHFVEAMDGSVGVHSVLGQGSQFWFTVCLQPGQQTTHIFLAGAENITCCVVGSYEPNQQILCQLLQAEGVKTHTFNALSAIDKKTLEALQQDTDNNVLWLSHPCVSDPNDEKLQRLMASGYRIILMGTSTNRKLVEKYAHDHHRVECITRPINKKQVKHVLAYLLGIELNGSKENNASEPNVISLKKRAEKRILLAEDNPVNRKLALKVLEKGGYQCGVAHDGKEALTQYKTQHWDAILMDCEMPKVDGFEATRQIRLLEQGKQVQGKHAIPIIAMTANAMQGDKEHCLDVGMTDYLAKPIKKEQLYQMIDKHIGV